MPVPRTLCSLVAARRGICIPGWPWRRIWLSGFPRPLITFVGGGRAMIDMSFERPGLALRSVPSQPAPQNALHAVRFVTDNVAGYWAARWFLKEKRVSAVVGLGGAASAPAVRAAISRGIPTLILEQNVVPGRVTRWLARSVTAVCAGFEETRGYFPAAVPLAVTGNPARPAFERIYREARLTGRRPHQKRLIIIGGAGGARSLNEHIPWALAKLRDELTGWQIVHQSGEGQLQQTEARYRTAGVDALVVAFIDEIAPVMFASDLVVCRPGGTTLAELSLASLPAILVPYPRAMDYHLPNAEIFAAAGAATIIDETEVTGSLEDALVEQLEPLIVDDARREKMAASMRRLARPGAAANVTNIVYEALFSASVRLAA